MRVVGQIGHAVSEPQPSTPEERRRSDTIAAFKGCFQKSSRLQESMRRLIHVEADVNRREMSPIEQENALAAVNIATKHVEHDAAVFDAALQEVTDLILYGR